MPSPMRSAWRTLRCRPRRGAFTPYWQAANNEAKKVKPRPFDYARPDTVDEALALLAEYGDDARILAGGQSLLPMLSLRLIDPAVLIDISRIAALDAVRDLGSEIEIGAAVTQNKLMAWPQLKLKL